MSSNQPQYPSYTSPQPQQSPGPQSQSPFQQEHPYAPPGSHSGQPHEYSQSPQPPQSQQHYQPQYQQPHGQEAQYQEQQQYPQYSAPEGPPPSLPPRNQSRQQQQGQEPFLPTGTDRAEQVETLQAYESQHTQTEADRHQETLRREFPGIDSSLIAAIYGDSGNLAATREMLMELSSGDT